MYQCKIIRCNLKYIKKLQINNHSFIATDNLNITNKYYTCIDQRIN